MLAAFPFICGCEITCRDVDMPNEEVIRHSMAATYYFIQRLHVVAKVIEHQLAVVVSETNMNHLERAIIHSEKCRRK